MTFQYHEEQTKCVAVVLENKITKIAEEFKNSWEILL